MYLYDPSLFFLKKKQFLASLKCNFNLHKTIVETGASVKALSDTDQIFQFCQIYFLLKTNLLFITPFV